MRNEVVAILDIRSGSITFALGSKGVNETFSIIDSHSEEYEGYLSDGFLDEDSFRFAVQKSVETVRQNYGGRLDRVFVGVPSPFVYIFTKGHTISFPSKRKLTKQDVDALFDSGLNELMQGGRCIHRSAMYFSLGDNRKYFSTDELYGTASTLLKGGLCYYFISEQLYERFYEILSEEGFSDIRFIPSGLAQTGYLLPPLKREGYAFLLDIGFLTTSLSVAYGNGVLHEKSFDCGVGAVRVALMRELGVDYETAEEILLEANISGGSVREDVVWTSERLDQSFSVQRINDTIKRNLDFLCEWVDNFFRQYYTEQESRAFSAFPIHVTGEGLTAIRGASEHLARRLNRLTEVVYPDLPYFDKPLYSSKISLLDAATKEVEKRGILQRLFGGRRK